MTWWPGRCRDRLRTAPRRGGGAGPAGPGIPEWREASRWREMEIELVTGSRELLDSAGAC